MPLASVACSPRVGFISKDRSQERIDPVIVNLKLLGTCIPRPRDHMLGMSSSPIGREPDPPPWNR